MSNVIGTQPIQLLPDEVKVLAFDFAADDAIVAGETLSGTPTVSAAGVGFAAGAEITVGAGSISGTKVQFLVTLAAAVVGNFYKFKCTCATSAGHTVEAIRRLEIIGEG